MDKNNLKSVIGNRIRTTSRNFISDSEIGTELNRSLDRLSSKLDITESIKETSISFSGDGSYSLPSDFLRPTMLYDDSNNVRYSRVSKGARIRGNDSSFDTYAILGSDIEISSGQDSTTLTLVYVSDNNAKDSMGNLQNGLSDGTDEPIIPGEYHDYFVEDVSMKLFRKSREYKDYQLAKQEREDIFMDLKRMYPGRTERITERITPYVESTNDDARVSEPPISN